MTPADITDVPRTCRSLWQLALDHGWMCWATTASGTPLDGAGRPQTVKERRETGEMTDGIAATETRKAVAPRPRVEVIDTGTPLVIESTVLRMARGDVRAWAGWEGSLFQSGAQQRPWRRLNSRDLKDLITSTPTETS